MAIPGSGPISMSMFNVELGRVSNTSNSSLAGGSTPAVGSLFYLANQSGSLNQTPPHSMSEWYGYSITTTTTTTSGCNYIYLGYNASDDGLACLQTSQLDIWMDDPDLTSATVLYNNSGCSSLSIGGWYSDGFVARFWDGTDFLFFPTLC